MTNTTSPPAWDAVAIANQLQTIAGQSQSLMQRFLSRQPAAGQIGMGDASTVGSAFLELMTKMMSDPVAVTNAQIGLFNEGMTVWRHAAERMFLMPESLVEPARGQEVQASRLDRERDVQSFIRGKLPRRREVAFVFGTRRQGARSCDRAKGGFLHASNSSSRMVVPPISSPPIRKRADDDPRRPGGAGIQNLLRGLENFLLADLDRGEGRPSITMTDMKSVPARRKTSRRRRERSSHRGTS